MYRLDVFSIEVPPLREHLPDLDDIAGALLAQLCQKYERCQPALKASDLASLRQHTFPGNVRELRNLLERSLLRSEPDARELSIDLDWLKSRSSAAVDAKPSWNT